MKLIDSQFTERLLTKSSIGTNKKVAWILKQSGAPISLYQIRNSEPRAEELVLLASEICEENNTSK